jgi:hypothetical protein
VIGTLCKILCHNLCCLIQSALELGIRATFREAEADKQARFTAALEAEKTAEAWAWV